MLAVAGGQRDRGCWGAAWVVCVVALAVSGLACSQSAPSSLRNDAAVGAPSDASADAATRDASADAGGDASFGFPGFGIDAGALDGGTRTPPTEVPANWSCRREFALDLICDCGCGALDAACMPLGCAEAGCAVPSCEACFDATGKEIACGGKGPFLCELARKGDGNCDCGCGDDDPDCGDQGCYAWGCNVSGCDVCLGSNGAWGACPTPSKWTCSKGALSDGKCDCGCGNLDPDCRLRSCTAAGCDAEGCEVCRDATGEIAACKKETPKWVCSSDLREDTVCDCGCGDTDPACASKGCSEPGCEASACKRCYDGFGRDVPCPAQYLCDTATYDDGQWCDCGCGATDPDCDGKGCAAASCKAKACDVRHDAKGKAIMPSGWVCSKASYGSGGSCDCGCGALDPDCRGGSGGCSTPGCQDDRCDLCHADGDSLLNCRFICDQAHFGSADGCDCGCGEQDPDCSGLGCDEASCFATFCDRCFDADATAIDCERSACDGAVFSDGVCDCGCREKDPDCAGTSACVTPGCSMESCGRCHDASGATQDCESWYCGFEQQGSGDGCNCGCGATDPDCLGNGCATPGCDAEACMTCRTNDKAPMSCAP